MKNISFSEPHRLLEQVDYADEKVVSRTLANTSGVGITLFAFSEGEGLSTHSAPGDAMVQILDGEASVTIGGKEVTAKTGEIVIMPADVPHSLHAHVPFKMMLTVVKKRKSED
ncbi:cupin domain-containing protein [Desulfomonile tiedjei]|nr:cupin domain-containing protein [Desulfomonile tiedjei]